MKGIRNIDSLEETLERDSENWQEIIYEKTGVVLEFLEFYTILVSCCGYIELEWDVEYSYDPKLGDTTEYIEISRIQDMIDYIKSMESYHECLSNTCYGNFSKADLFWTIYEQILFPELERKRKKELEGAYSDNIYRYILKRIETRDKEELLQVSIEDHGDYVISLVIKNDMHLDEVLEELSNQMKDTVDVTSNSDIYDVHRDIKVEIPNTFHSLKRMFDELEIFIE